MDAVSATIFGGGQAIRRKQDELDNFQTEVDCGVVME
jgi:hypothetical protein